MDLGSLLGQKCLNARCILRLADLYHTCKMTKNMQNQVLAFFINKKSFFSVKGVGGEAVTLLLDPHSAKYFCRNHGDQRGFKIEMILNVIIHILLFQCGDRL